MTDQNLPQLDPLTQVENALLDQMPWEPVDAADAGAVDIVYTASTDEP